MNTKRRHLCKHMSHARQGDIPSIIRYGNAAYGTVILSMLNEECWHSFPVDDAYERSRELSPPSLRQRSTDSLRA